MKLEIIISKENVRAEEFVDWLHEQGHTAVLSDGPENYIDGRLVDNNLAEATMWGLWREYCRHWLKS